MPWAQSTGKSACVRVKVSNSRGHFCAEHWRGASSNELKGAAPLLFWLSCIGVKVMAD